jgi:hypothetical protein
MTDRVISDFRDDELRELEARAAALFGEGAVLADVDAQVPRCWSRRRNQRERWSNFAATRTLIDAAAAVNQGRG